MASTPGKAIEARVQERAAELYGLGLSQREAAGACGISEKSVERILRKPEYRKLADDVRRKRTSVTVQAAAVVSELLSATDDNGNPAMGLRKMGAELVMKNPTLLESVEDVEGDDSLLPGVVLRFPWGGAVENPRKRAGGESAEQGSALSHESENGITLHTEPESSETDSPLLAPPPGETLNLRDDDEAVEAAFEELLEDEPPAPTPYDPMRSTELGGDRLRELAAESEPVQPEPESRILAEPAPLFTEADLA